MRIASCTVLAMLFVCGACANVTHDRTPSPMIVVAYEDAKFIPVDPGRPDSPEIAVLWGDPRTGPSAMLIRLRKGPQPMHTHSSDYHLVVLQGVVKHWSADETESDAKPLGPGSYWFQPGNEAHADSCVSDVCVAHLVWSGKQDGQLAEPRRK